MRIKLDDKHFLNADQCCYWITCEAKRENGKTYERRVSGYCRTFAEAVNTFVEKSIGSSDVETLQELSAKVDELKATVESWKVAVEKE